ncbi:MAG: hypothetical protein ACJ73L_11165 [Actinomycetes bacterium]
MELSNVKIVDDDGTARLLVSRDDAIDLQDLHPFLTERGYVLREGPKPPDVVDADLGECAVFWLRRFSPHQAQNHGQRGF